MDETTVGIIGAVLGFVGVIVGSLLSFLTDYFRHHIATKKEAAYLVIQLSNRLERFAIGCADIIRDDGLSYGQRDERGCKVTQVSVPTFDPHSVDVNWRSIPAALMDEVIYLPMEVETANSQIAGAGEHAFPPDFEEFYEERQYQYSILGEKAVRLAARLRVYAGLDSRHLNQWNSEKYFSDEKLKIEHIRETRAATYQNLDAVDL